MTAPSKSSSINSARVASKAKLIHRACTALLLAGSRPTLQKVADHDQDLSIATVSRAYHRRITQAAQARFDRATSTDELDEFSRIAERIADGSWVSSIFQEISEQKLRGRTGRHGCSCGEGDGGGSPDRSEVRIERARRRIRKLTAAVSRLEAELAQCRKEIVILSAAPLPFRPFVDPKETS